MNPFTLYRGRWKLVRRDGSEECVESDGTNQIDLDTMAFVFAEPTPLAKKAPVNPPQSDHASG